MRLRFQKCTLSDLDQLIEISRTTFVTSFEKDNNPEDFKNYIDQAFERSKIRQQLNNQHSSFYFVFKDEVLTGYFKINENEAQTELQAENSLELERIYVLQDFQGQQIGKHIIQEVQNIGVRLNKEFVWLGVWQKNEDAIRFYERYGFVKFGTHPYYIGKDKQTDWLMRFDLTNFQQD